MTAPQYFELFLSALELADLGSFVATPDGIATYAAPAQPVSPDLPVLLSLENTPHGNNKTAHAPAAPQPVPQLTPEEAMLLLMQRLASPSMPFWIRETARDWLKHRHVPNAMHKAWQFFRFLMQQRPALISRIDNDGSIRAALGNPKTMPQRAHAARANLKNMQNAAPDGPIALQPTIAVASRHLKKLREMQARLASITDAA